MIYSCKYLCPRLLFNPLGLLVLLGPLGIYPRPHPVPLPPNNYDTHGPMARGCRYHLGLITLLPILNITVNINLNLLLIGRSIECHCYRMLITWAERHIALKQICNTLHSHLHERC